MSSTPALDARRRRRDRALGRLDLLPALAGALVLVPVAVGIAIAVVRLVSIRHPSLAWGTAVNSDAEAIFLGRWPYSDPAKGYTGEGYTPLYPVAVSLLHRIHLWNGWPVLVTVASSLALASMAAVLAWTAPARPTRVGYATRVVEAAAVGALAWSFVRGLQLHELFEARVDHFAWALALGGLLALPGAVRGSRERLLIFLLLVSAGFWAKQTTLIVPAAALLVWAAACVTKRAASGPLLRAVVSLVAGNVGLLLLLQLATRGWQWRFNFDLSFAATRSVWNVTGELLSRAALPLCVLGALLAIGWLSRHRVPADASAPRERQADPILVAALVVAAVFAVVTGIYVRRYYGADQNDFIGAIWLLGLLVAVAYGRARRVPGGALPVAALIALVAATSVLGSSAFSLRRGDVVPTWSWSAFPPEFLKLTDNKVRVYDPVFGDLNVRSLQEIYSNGQHMLELLERGHQPIVMRDSLLQRRFDVITDGFGPALDPQLALTDRGEDNYFWKLNRVLAEKYVAEPRAPRLPAGADFLTAESPPALVPRPGLDPAPWIDHCFGPFELAGASFVIHHGGGLWCQDPGGLAVLRLRETPADITEIETEGAAGSVTGSLQIRMNLLPGWWLIDAGSGFQMRATIAPELDGVHLEVTREGEAPARRFIPRRALRPSKGAVRIDFAGAAAGGLRVNDGDPPAIEVGPLESDAPLRIETTGTSGLRMDFRDLRLR